MRTLKSWLVHFKAGSSALGYNLLLKNCIASLHATDHADSIIYGLNLQKNWMEKWKRKILLSLNLFIIWVCYGAGKEGYQTCEHMAVQFKDGLDCIQDHFPQFDSMLIFDHRCGNDPGWDNELFVSNMSTSWGEQPWAWSAEI